MIEQWFQKDIRQQLDEHHRLVITDTKGEGAFLIALLPARVTVPVRKTVSGLIKLMHGQLVGNGNATRYYSRKNGYPILFECTNVNSKNNLVRQLPELSEHWLAIEQE